MVFFWTIMVVFLKYTVYIYVLMYTHISSGNVSNTQPRSSYRRKQQVLGNTIYGHLHVYVYIKIMGNCMNLKLLKRMNHPNSWEITIKQLAINSCYISSLVVVVSCFDVLGSDLLWTANLSFSNKLFVGTCLLVVTTHQPCCFVARLVIRYYILFLLIKGCSSMKHHQPSLSNHFITMINAINYWPLTVINHH